MLRDFFQYLPPHDADRVWGLEIIAGGRSVIGPGRAYPPPCHPVGHAFDWEAGRTLDEFQVVLIAAGRGRFRSRTAGERMVQTGDVFVLFPGEWHSYRPEPATGWQECWLACTGEVPQRLLRAGMLSPDHPVIATARDPELADVFAHALDRLDREPPGYRAELAAAALGILARLVAIREREAGGDASAHARILRTLAARIHDECPTQIDVAALAQEAGLSAAQFRRVFAAVIGMPPKAYHQHIRMARARHLLSDHRASVSAVAAALGFESAFYFTRLFRQHHGASPVRWRAGR